MSLRVAHRRVGGNGGYHIQHTATTYTTIAIRCCFGAPGLGWVLLLDCCPSLRRSSTLAMGISVASFSLRQRTVRGLLQSMPVHIGIARDTLFVHLVELGFVVLVVLPQRLYTTEVLLYVRLASKNMATAKTINEHYLIDSNGAISVLNSIYGLRRFHFMTIECSDRRWR